jgi:hypothetical protein
MRHKSVNIPLSQSWIQDGDLQDGGRGTHVTHFVQLYPPTTINCEPGAYYKPFVLTDLCLTL